MLVPMIFVVANLMHSRFVHTKTHFGATLGYFNPYSRFTRVNFCKFWFWVDKLPANICFFFSSSTSSARACWKRKALPRRRDFSFTCKNWWVSSCFCREVAGRTETYGCLSIMFFITFRGANLRLRFFCWATHHDFSSSLYMIFLQNEDMWMRALRWILFESNDDQNTTGFRSLPPS